MSPRPRKKRCCEGKFYDRVYKPAGAPLCNLEQIILHRDELEALKLCDLEGLFQEQAGERMGVSRGTIQRILTSARKKTAEALVSGAALIFADSKE
ncbi:MAG: DUF134 domain-containing protein [Candidatus Electrothrix sp. AR4]|nr:DUF134 domain-containing protein [Candidatus Electrothrix sp. AR4]